jgi:hypothetical protein
VQIDVILGEIGKMVEGTEKRETIGEIMDENVIAMTNGMQTVTGSATVNKVGELDPRNLTRNSRRSVMERGIWNSPSQTRLHTSIPYTKDQT